MKVCMAALVRYATGSIWREQTFDNGFDICISATGNGFCHGIDVGVPEGEPMPQVGDFVTATITHAGRHNLIADPDLKAGQTYAVRH